MMDLGPNSGLIGEPHSRDRLLTPALVIDADALDRNIAKMATFSRESGVALRPHAKTHKSSRIARMQIEAGAVGISVAVIGEAEVMVRAGIPDVLVTSPVVADRKIERLTSLNHQATGLMVVADNPRNVRSLNEAAATTNKTLKVLVDLDVGIGRTGVRTPECGLEVAKEIADSPFLEFGGIQAYAGKLQHIENYEERRAAAAMENAKVLELRKMLDAAGLTPPLITGAGTGTHEIDARYSAFDELQVGSYLFTDVQYNVVSLRENEPRPFEPSLFVQLTVISINQEGFVTTDGGLKRFATDGPLPEPAIGVPPGTVYAFKGDEHGVVHVKKANEQLPLGAVLACITPHCDPTVNLYDHYHVVRGDTLIDIWPVEARGAV